MLTVLHNVEREMRHIVRKLLENKTNYKKTKKVIFCDIFLRLLDKFLQRDYGMPLATKVQALQYVGTECLGHMANLLTR